jgi:hypothetical protein
MTQVFFVAGKDHFSNFLEGFELVGDLWEKGGRGCLNF